MRQLAEDEQEDQVKETWPTELRVLIVGDRPAKANHSQEVAFKGSQSGKTLDGWLHRIGVAVDAYTAINRTDEYFVECAKSFHRAGIPVLALGVEAHKALEKAHIPHFRLPHPSGLNRSLNDKNKLEVLLMRCRRYILDNEQFREV